MMIRTADFKDINGIISLWQEAFGDSEESIRFFLDRRFLPQNTVVADDNGNIVSMLFLLDGKVAADNNLFSAYYLYAAATLKAHRGRGIMAKMLEFAKELAFERKVDLICLKPAETSLYDYYSKFGYKSVFALKTVKIHRSKQVSSVKGITDACADYYKSRENAFVNYGRFIWDKDAVNFAVDFYKHYGGKVFENCNGFCLYSEFDNSLVVKELCFTTDSAYNYANNLTNNSNLKSIEIDLPVEFSICSDDSVIKPNGMAVAVTELGLNIYQYNNLYLNLTLD